jgi:hypothetical protein
VLISFADIKGEEAGQKLLLRILKCAEAMNPDKDARAYWLNMNRSILQFDRTLSELWQTEKLATLEVIQIAREEALTFLAEERERIMRMTRGEAILHLIRNRNIEGREKVVRAVADNGIFAIL